MVAAGQAGVPVATVGKAGGDQISFGSDSAPLADLALIYRTSFEKALA